MNDEEEEVPQAGAASPSPFPESGKSESPTSDGASPFNFTSEVEELQRTNRLHLYPYCLRREKNMGLDYSPVKFLKGEMKHKHRQEMVSSA